MGLAPRALQDRQHHSRDREAAMKPRLYVATFLALALTTAVIADWPLFRGNSLQTGVAKSKLPEALEIVWKVRAKDGVDGTAAIVDKVVYVGSYDGFLYALAL